MKYDKVMDAFKCACNYSSVKSYSRFLFNLKGELKQMTIKPSPFGMNEGK